jgi:hypothetical protein
MTVSLNSEVRARLDAHLDAVEQALAAAGSSRERRRGVVDDLESQILDMLAAKSASPTLADLEAVLAELDPPAAYGDSAAGRAVPPAQPARGGMTAPAPLPRYSRTAIWGLVLILLSFLPLPLIFVLLMFLGVQVTRPAPVMVSIPPAVEAGGPSSRSATAAMTMPVMATEPRFGATFGWDGVCVLLPILPLALAETFLGWLAHRQIRASRGMLRGRGMALFDGLFYPSIIVLLVGIRLLFSLL